MAFKLSWLEILLLKLVSRCWLVGRPDSVVGYNVGWEWAYTWITIGQGGDHGKETTEGFSDDGNGEDEVGGDLAAGMHVMMG